MEQGTASPAGTRDRVMTVPYRTVRVPPAGSPHDIIRRAVMLTDDYLRMERNVLRNGSNAMILQDAIKKTKKAETKLLSRKQKKSTSGCTGYIGR
ncbi:hypothetical protein VTN02DRAFT_4762 [Thermoascus thermophilus]